MLSSRAGHAQWAACRGRTAGLVRAAVGEAVVPLVGGGCLPPAIRVSITTSTVTAAAASVARPAASRGLFVAAAVPVPVTLSTGAVAAPPPAIFAACAVSAAAAVWRITPMTRRAFSDHHRSKPMSDSVDDDDEYHVDGPKPVPAGEVVTVSGGIPIPRNDDDENGGPKALPADAYDMPSSQTDSATLIAPRDRKLRAVVFDTNGNYVEHHYSRQELLEATGLTLRDLRHVDARYKQVTAILPRDSSIVITLEHIRSIVLRDKVFIFSASPPVVAHFATNFRKHLRARLIEGSYPGLVHHPFEFHATEAVLHTVTSSYQRHLQTLAPVVENILVSLTSDTSEECLRRLLPLKNSLSDFHFSVKYAIDVIDGVMANDEDMVEMYLTYAHVHKAKPPLDDHKDVEIILENYARQLSEINNDIIQLMKTIESSQEIITLNLDATRNRIIRLNLYIAMGTLGFSFSATVAGIFGMNLVSGLEEHPTAFYNTVSAVILSMGALYCMTFLYYRGSDRERQRVADFTALTYLLPSLEDAEQILFSKAYRDKECFTPAEFLELMQQTGRKEITKKDVALIFRVFDTNEDGNISHREFLASLRRKKHGMSRGLLSSSGRRGSRRFSR